MTELERSLALSYARSNSRFLRNAKFQLTTIGYGAIADVADGLWPQKCWKKTRFLKWSSNFVPCAQTA
jgi:hypothetical protein